MKEYNCKPLLMFSLLYSVLFLSIQCEYRNISEVTTDITLANTIKDVLVEVVKFGTEKDAVIHISLPSKLHKQSSITTMNYDMLLKSMSNNWKILVSNTIHMSSTYNIKPKAYILLVGDSQPLADLRQHITVLSYAIKSWNPRAFFIIMIPAKNFEDSDQLSLDIINYMWSQNILKLYLILSLLSNVPEFKLTTGFPYSQSSVCRTINSSGDLTVHHLKKFPSNLSLDLILFNQIKNFHKCTIYAMTYPFPPYSLADVMEINKTSHYIYKSGFEVHIVLLLAEKSNISLVVRTADTNYNPWFDVLPNGSTVGMITELRCGRTDLAFAGVIPVPVSYDVFDYSQTYSFGSISWFVPNPDRIPHWQSLIRVFPTKLWFALLSVFIIVTVIFYLIQNISLHEEFAVYTSYFSAALIIFGTGIGCPSFKLPKSNYLKVIFMLWVTYSLHIGTAYTSLLFGYITQPPYYNTVNTINDLYKSRLKTCLSDMYYTFYNETNDEKISTILNNRLVCNDLEEAVEKFVQYRNFSLLAKAENIDFAISEIRSSTHKIHDNLVTYNLMLIASKGSAVLSRLNWVISQTMESGLLNKWKDDMKLFNTKRLDYLLGTNSNYAPNSLNLVDIQGGIFILIVGFVMATLTFIGELIKSKYFTCC